MPQLMTGRNPHSAQKRAVCVIGGDPRAEYPKPSPPAEDDRRDPCPAQEGAPKNPRAVGEAIQAALKESPAIKSTSIAGPGFVNLVLNDAWLAARTDNMLRRGIACWAPLLKVLRSQGVGFRPHSLRCCDLGLGVSALQLKVLRSQGLGLGPRASAPPRQ